MSIPLQSPSQYVTHVHTTTVTFSVCHSCPYHYSHLLSMSLMSIPLQSPSQYVTHVHTTTVTFSVCHSCPYHYSHLLSMSLMSIPLQSPSQYVTHVHTATVTFSVCHSCPYHYSHLLSMSLMSIPLQSPSQYVTHVPLSVVSPSCAPMLAPFTHRNILVSVLHGRSPSFSRISQLCSYACTLHPSQHSRLSLTRKVSLLQSYLPVVLLCLHPSPIATFSSQSYTEGLPPSVVSPSCAPMLAPFTHRNILVSVLHGRSPSFSRISQLCSYACTLHPSQHSRLSLTRKVFLCLPHCSGLGPVHHGGPDCSNHLFHVRLTLFLNSVFLIVQVSAPYTMVGLTVPTIYSMLGSLCSSTVPHFLLLHQSLLPDT